MAIHGGPGSAYQGGDWGPMMDSPFNHRCECGALAWHQGPCIDDNVPRLDHSDALDPEHTEGGAQIDRHGGPITATAATGGCCGCCGMAGAVAATAAAIATAAEERVAGGNGGEEERISRLGLYPKIFLDQKVKPFKAI